jgi:hypothetical protein
LVEKKRQMNFSTKAFKSVLVPPGARAVRVQGGHKGGKVVGLEPAALEVDGIGEVDV